jgi:hypothetical protein
MRHATRRLHLKTGRREYLTHRRFLVSGVGNSTTSARECLSVVSPKEHCSGGKPLTGCWSVLCRIISTA